MHIMQCPFLLFHVSWCAHFPKSSWKSYGKANTMCKIMWGPFTGLQNTHAQTNVCIHAWWIVGPFLWLVTPKALATATSSILFQVCCSRRRYRHRFSSNMYHLCRVCASVVVPTAFCPFKGLVSCFHTHNASALQESFHLHPSRKAWHIAHSSLYF